MANAAGTRSVSKQMVCMKCRTVQSSSIANPRLVCAKGHRLQTLQYLQLRSKLMAPFGFMAHLGSILLPSSIVIGFGYYRYVDFMLWAIFGASIFFGLTGLIKSLDQRSKSRSTFFHEYRLRFYEGWLCSTAVVLVLLAFGFVVESFSRNHPFVIQG